MGAMDPERLKRRFQQGAELVEAGKLDAAIAAFTEIVQEQPDLEDVYPVLCELHLRAERRDIPQSWVTRGIGRNPSFRDAFLEMARGCEVLFDALPLLHGIAEALPEDAEIWSELGRIQAELNLHDEAERSLQRAISLGRTDAETAARLADLHDATGRPEEATRLRREAGLEAPPAPTPPGGKKLLVIGVDGATLRIIEPLVARGLLPNFRRLLEEGTSRVLRSTIPYLTPTAWQSIALGVNAGKHGTWEFKHRVEGGYGWKLLQPTRTGRYWDHVGATGRRVGTIDFPCTYPADPVNGFHLAGRAVPSRTDFPYPKDIEEQLGIEYLAQPPVPQGADDEYLGGIETLRAFITGWVELTENRLLALKNAMAEGSYDLLTCVFSITDRLSHWFWPCHDEAHPRSRELREIYGDPVVYGYRVVDRCLGEILEAMDAQTNLILISDHGFTTVKSFFNVNNWLRREGYMTWLDDVPIDLARKDDWFDLHVDWEKTRVYCFGNGHLFVNLRGREPKGIVEPGEAYERLRDELTEKLYALRDPDGTRVFQLVARKEEIYEGPHLPRMPDLVTITTNDEFVAKDELLPTNPDFLFGPPPLTGAGYHAMDGTFIAAGPDIRRGGRLDDAQMVDVAPTILRFFGIAPTPEMDGQVLEDVLGEGVTVAAAPAAAAEAAPEEAPVDPDSEEEIRRQLRGLGYL